MNSNGRNVPSLLGAAFAGLLALSACGGTAAPASAPTSGASGAFAASAAKPAASGDAKWNDLLAAARKEGKVVVMGTPIQPLADAYAQEFPKDTGVQIEYEQVPTGEAGVRAPRELGTGSPTFDVIQSGAFPMDALEPKGFLQPIKPLLILPEVTDNSAWRGDKGIIWMDSKGVDVPRPTSSASPLLFINSDQLQPGALKSVKELLDPKWKGKIVASDPRMVGPGQANATYLYDVMGADFVTQLFKNQGVTLVKSDRQAAEGVARGTYAIALGVSTQSAEPFRTEKLPIAPDMPPDAPGYVTGGFSPLAYVKGAPHPNAAAVFLNWNLSKAGQTAYSKATLEVSTRKDVSTDGIPPYRVPKEGVNYLDTYGSEYYLTKRIPNTQALVKLLSD
jgi:ABC-type Fe3+ transport system substrate-binding protein